MNTLAAWYVRLLRWRTVVLPLAVYACGSDVAGRSALSEKPARTFGFRVDAVDSVSFADFDPQFAQAVTLDDSTFGVSAHPREPVCVINASRSQSTCRSVIGGGPGEIESVEQLGVWPPGGLAVWDRQTGRLGVWDRSLQVGATISVLDASSTGVDLLGVLPDSTILIGKGTAFHDMPLAVFANPSRIEYWKDAQRVPRPEYDIRGYWLSVVAIGTSRSGLSIESTPESFVSVSSKGARIVDARYCKITAADSAVARPVLLPGCPGRIGFRDSVLVQLSRMKGPASKEHQAAGSASVIPERFVAITSVLEDYGSGEIAVRFPAETGSASTWAFVRPDRSPPISVVVPRPWRLIGLSSTFLLMVKRDAEDGFAPMSVYWVRRSDMQPTGDTTTSQLPSAEPR
ncbi:MAG: hypothetical protein ABMA00_06175 [Gemmatimonas sp.]